MARTCVILTALSLERGAVTDHLATKQDIQVDPGTVYTRGSFRAGLHDWTVFVTETGAGNVEAAIEAERAARELNPDVLLFVGVAGGIKDVRLGDVVAATSVIPYERSKSIDDGLLSRAAGAACPCSYPLVSLARAIAATSSWRRRIRNRLRSAARTRGPVVKSGPIAAGEKVLTSTKEAVFAFVREHHSDAVAVDMEGYGFLRAARQRSHLLSLVIRGISDLIDNKAKVDAKGSQARAARHAAAFAFELLAKLGPSDQSSLAATVCDSTETRTSRPTTFARYRPHLEALVTMCRKRLEDFIPRRLRLPRSDQPPLTPETLLKSPGSAAIISPVGSGKTYLLYQAALKLATDQSNTAEYGVPVILDASAWQRRPDLKLLDEVERRLKVTLAALLPEALAADFAQRRFTILLDNYEAAGIGFPTLRQQIDELSSGGTCRFVIAVHLAQPSAPIPAGITPYELDSLSIEEICRLSERVTGNPHFWYALPEDLQRLCQQPLFLKLAIDYSLLHPHEPVPRWRTDLYLGYLQHLLRNRHQLGLFEDRTGLTYEAKLRVLEEWAIRSFPRGPHPADLPVAMAHAGCANLDPVALLDVLLDSGVLIGERSSPEFFHPTLADYLVARSLAGAPLHRLSSFATSSVRDVAYSTVFILLASLLATGPQQDALFRVLEESNLRLLSECTKARYRLDSKSHTPHEADWPSTYFTRLLESYTRVVDHACPKLKWVLPPWRAYGGTLPVGYAVGINGAIDGGRANISFRFSTIPESGARVKTAHVDLPLQMSINGEVTQLAKARIGDVVSVSLPLNRMGLDSARDLALGEVRAGLREWIDRWVPQLTDQTVAEQLASSIEQLAWTCRHTTNLATPAISRLTPAMSVGELLEVLMPVEQTSYYEYPSGHRAPCPVSWAVVHLKRLQSMGCELRDLLLPGPDIDAREIVPEQGGGCWSTDLWSDARIEEWLQAFYPAWETAHRHVVVTYLGESVSRQCPLYLAGPHRFVVEYYLDRGNPLGAQWSWYSLPVAPEQVHVEVRRQTTPLSLAADWARLREQYNRALVWLGRSGSGFQYSVGCELPFLGSMPLTTILQRSIRDELTAILGPLTD